MPTITTVLEHTWNTLTTHTKTYFIYFLLFTVPILVIELFQSLVLDTTTITSTTIGVGFISYTIMSLLGIWVTLALILSVTHALTETSEPIVKQDLRTAAKYLLPAVGLTIISSILITISLFFLIIPGIVLAVYLTFIYHTLLLEKKSVVQSIKSSFHRVKGHFWHIIFHLIGITLFVSFFAIFISVILVFVLALLGLDSIIPLVTLATSAVTALFIMTAVTYIYLALYNASLPSMQERTSLSPTQ